MPQFALIRGHWPLFKIEGNLAWYSDVRNIGYLPEHEVPLNLTTFIHTVYRIVTGSRGNLTQNKGIIKEYLYYIATKD